MSMLPLLQLPLHLPTLMIPLMLPLPRLLSLLLLTVLRRLPLSQPHTSTTDTMAVTHMVPMPMVPTHMVLMLMEDTHMLDTAMLDTNMSMVSLSPPRRNKLQPPRRENLGCFICVCSTQSSTRIHSADFFSMT